MLGLPLHSLAQFTYQVTNSAGQTPTYKGRAAFSTNAEGVRVFNNEILVKAPSTGEYTSEFSSTLITLKPNVGVLIKTRAQTDVISGPEKLTVVSNFSAPGFLFQENCKEQNFKIVSAPAKVPFFLGVSCAVKDDIGKLAVSFPEEVELVKTSVFELKGKGESWRLFDLGNVAAASGLLAELQLKHKDITYTFKLISSNYSGKELDKVKKNIDSSRAVVGTGFMNMSLVTEIETVSQGKPLLFVETVPYVSDSGFDLSGGAKIALDSGKDLKSLSYSDLQGRLGYSFKLGDSYFSTRAIFFSTNFEESSSRAGYQQSLVGLGFSFFSKQDTFYQIQLSTAQLSSKSLKANYQLQYLQEFKLFGTKLDIGLDYSFYQYINAAAISRNFTAIGLLLGLSF